MVLCPHCRAPSEDGHRFCAACGGTLEPVARRADPMIGRTLPGGYLVQHLAGIGGMGRVYLAEQTALGRTVAVKVIHPHLIGDEQAAGRFITEARAASRLNHPNSVGIFDFGKTTDGQLYLVMEYLRGKDLARVLHEEGSLPFRRVVDVLRQTLAALQEAHELGIVHRDLKPENIVLEPMRGAKDFVKVVDYGLAKIHEATRNAPVTAPGFVCGTPEYMSPEQGRGDALDARSDVYSVGVILYQLLTGRLPFDGETSTRLLLAHLSEVPRDPREVAPQRNIPDALAAITLRALAKSPSDRFASAKELGDALLEALEESERWDSSPPPTAIRCEGCGGSCPKAMKFCGECGAPMSIGTPRRTPPMALAEGGPPLVDREADLAWLEARRDEALVFPCTARIVGRPGMGKTRLVSEFLTRCTTRGDSVTRVSVPAHAHEISAFAVRAAIAELAGGSPAEWKPEGRAAERGLADLFAPMTHDDDRDDAPSSAIDRRAAVAEALRWAIRRASDRAGFAVVVVAVDDLDEIDGVSKNAFADVMAEPPVVPSLLIVAYAVDPTDAPAGLAEERVLGEVRDGPVLRSPLYIEQRERWTRERRDAPPGTLADIVAARIESLGDGAKKLLLALAVLGDDADHATLAKLVPSVDLDAAEHALERAGMRRGRNIAHPLFCQLALSVAPAAVRRELHAAALDARGEKAPLELRAMHAAHADRAFEALILLDDVGVQRASRGDIGGAVRALRAGLDVARREMFRGEIEDPIHAVVHFSRKLGDALVQADAFTDAEGILREALDLAPPKDAERAHLLGSLARVAHAREHQREAERYLEEALRIARQSDARELVSSLESFEKSMAG